MTEHEQLKEKCLEALREWHTTLMELRNVDRISIARRKAEDKHFDSGVNLVKATDALLAYEEKQ